MPYNTDINDIKDGEGGSAAVATRPHIKLLENTDFLKAILDKLGAKGDLLVHNGTDFAKIAIGTNNQILIADSTQSIGMKWGDAFMTRKTSEGQVNTNLDVGTVEDTPELVYSFTGAGLLTAITIAAAVPATIRQCILDITIDGGANYEIDGADYFVSTGARANPWGVGGTAAVATVALIPFNAEFNTSIVINGRNDGGTEVTEVSVSSSEDQ